MFYLFPRVVKQDVCEEIIKDCMSRNLEIATIINPDHSSSRDDPNIRKTSIYFVPTDRNNKANEIAWHFLKEANKQMFHYDLTYFQSIQFSVYKDGGFFDWHTDSYHQDQPNKTRKLSLSLVLSNPNTFEGGKLEFYNGGRSWEEKGDATGEQIKIDLESQGTIVVFDSRDYHRVTPVTKGIRYSVVCWATGASFR